MEGSSRSRPRVVEGDCRERGLGIISLRAPGIEAQFGTEVSPTRPQPFSMVVEHDRHGPSLYATVDKRRYRRKIISLSSINELYFARARSDQRISHSDYLLCYFNDVNIVLPNDSASAHRAEN